MHVAMTGNVNRPACWRGVAGNTYAGISLLRGKVSPLPCVAADRMLPLRLPRQRDTIHHQMGEAPPMCRWTPEAFGDNRDAAHDHRVDEDQPSIALNICADSHHRL